MSNLKYLSETELRLAVSRTAAHRAHLLAKALELEAAAARLTVEAAAKRRDYHNLGQREAGARVYLARKAGEA